MWILRCGDEDESVARILPTEDLPEHGGPDRTSTPLLVKARRSRVDLPDHPLSSVPHSCLHRAPAGEVSPP